MARPQPPPHRAVRLHPHGVSLPSHPLDRPLLALSSPRPPVTQRPLPPPPLPAADFRAAFRALTSISRAEVAATAALGLLLAGGATLLEDTSQSLWARHNQGVSLE